MFKRSNFKTFTVAARLRRFILPIARRECGAGGINTGIGRGDTTVKEGPGGRSVCGKMTRDHPPVILFTPPNKLYPPTTDNACGHPTIGAVSGPRICHPPLIVGAIRSLWWP